MDGRCAIFCRNSLFMGSTRYKCSSLPSADVGINCFISVYSSFSTCVAIIGLYGYVHYERHMIISDLSKNSSKVPRPCGGHSQEFGE